MPGSMDGLFLPPVPWQRISPRLALIRRLGVGVAALVIGVPMVVVLFVVREVADLSSAVVWGPVIALLAVVAWAWWLVGRNARRWGYAEGPEELYITRGALFRRLVVVPYGRMQFVDVQAGPLDQLAGIAGVRLHTASPGTTAVIPGLPAAEAARLRDRLTALFTELGEARSAGL